MNDILQGINEVGGVTGSALFDSQNACIAHLCPPPFEPILLGQVMSEVRSALDYLNHLDDAAQWEMLTAAFEGGYVIMRRLEGDVTVMALAQPTVNTAMLGIAFNVAGLKLAKRGQMPPASGPISGPLSSRSGMRSGSGTSMSLSDSGGGGGPAPPNAVGHEVMSALLKCLAKQVGPFAKIVLKEELTKLGVTAHTIVRGQFEDLVLLLLPRIPDPTKRKEFLEAVGKIPNR